MRRQVMAVGALAVALEAVAQSPPNVQKIDPAWLRADTATKTAEFDLTAGLTGYRGALNFNGYADGQLTLTVPLGWTVVQGLQAREADDLRFVANRAGSFIVFCAVPGHGAAGMWIRLVVSDTARRPSLAATSAGGQGGS